MSLDDAIVRLVSSTEDCAELKSWLGERHAGMLCCDTETTGLDHQRDVVRMVQVGDERTGWAIPADDWRGLVKEVLSIAEPWGFWNSTYDAHMLRRYCGVVPRRVHDGAVLAHLEDPLLRRALKEVSARKVDPRARELDARLEARMDEHKWTWATVPVDFPPYWTYAALDCVLTSRCIGDLLPRAQAAGQEPLYELELASARVCEKMEDRGIQVDVEYSQREQLRLEDEVETIRRECKEVYGISIGTKADVASILVRAGWVPGEITKGGVPSLKKSSLAGFDHPLARMWSQKESKQRLAHTYFRKIVQLASAGGRLHPNINSLEAKTGRMSIDTPSLQNLPRGRVVRDAFLAAPGHKLVLADFAQIELRILAHLAVEPAMIAFFLSGADMPQEVARAVFSIPDKDAVPPELRQKVKSTLYSLVYGAGASKIGLVLGGTAEDGQAFLDRLFGLYPRIKWYQEEVQRRAVERDPEKPWVESPKWKRRYATWDPRKAYVLANHLIQGEAGIAFKRQLVELDLAGLGDYLVIPVHDEVGLEVPEGEVEEVRALVAETLPDLTSYRVPLTVEVGPGYNRWGEKFSAWEETA